MNSSKARTVGVLTMVLAMVAILLPTPALAHPRSGDTPAFNESNGCGQVSGMLPPMADITNPDANRSLPTTHRVLGPYGAFYGRTYDQVSSSLVWWEVPMSGGIHVKVHDRALPAFQEVTRLLAAEEAAGNYYDVRMAAGFTWRRVSGRYRMSHHSFGSSVDINWDRNPYITGEPPSNRSAYTDMPEWFVEAWRAAGFCWGGDWVGVKDAMHFSWKGPISTPGYGALPDVFNPVTGATTYTGVDFQLDPGFGPALGGDHYAVADASRDGAPDIVRIRAIGGARWRIAIAHASHDFERCGVLEVDTPPRPFGADHMGLADLDRDGRADFWIVRTSGGITRIAYTGITTNRSWTVVQLPEGLASADAIRFADRDRDGFTDLFGLTLNGGSVDLTVFDGSASWQVSMVTTSLDIDSDEYPFVDVADRGGDGIPDVIATGPGDSLVAIASGSSSYSNVFYVAAQIPSDTSSVSFADIDGDGRDDLFALGFAGSADIFQAGNASTGDVYWYLHHNWACEPLGGAAKPYDLNGDSFADTVGAAPGEDLGTTDNAGAVVTTAGGATLSISGPSSSWSQARSDVLGSKEANDRFGAAVTSADLNGDGHADLIVGIPHEDVGSLTDAGMVSIILGSANGPTATGDILLSQASAGVPGTPEPGDRFGAVLAAGDFNDDGRYDLIVGVPGEGLGSRSQAGLVNLFYGNRWRVVVKPGQLHQGFADVAAYPEAGDQFGSSLAVGDFNGDGYDDLAVGAPGEDLGTTPDVGLVHVFYGSTDGLTASGSDLWGPSSATNGVTASDPNTMFGQSLAAGDFDADGYDDLAIGAPEHKGAGVVVVLAGSASGLSVSETAPLQQGSGGIAGARESGDQFGYALAAGDLNGDGHDDLVVSVVGEDLSTTVDAGVIHAIPGGSSGLIPSASTGASQLRSQIWGNPERNDRFGSSLYIADLDNDGAGDIVIGVEGEGVGNRAGGGIIQVVPGKIGGFIDLGRAFALYQSNGLPGAHEAGDGLGGGEIK